jgi:hypothetical protein
MEYNPMHMVVYHNPETPYPFLMQMSPMNFYSLIRSAACRLIENYELQKFDKNDSHCRSVPQATRLAQTVLLGLPGIKCGIHADEFITQLEDIKLLRAYIRIVNSRTFPDHNPGEDYAKLLVYVAIQRHQTLTVAMIKDEHRRNGKNFGSACDYQKKDNFKDVADWYVKHNLNNLLEQPLEHPVLPKDEPGYFDWVEIPRTLTENHTSWFSVLYRDVGTISPIELKIYDFVSGEKVLVKEACSNLRELHEKALALLAADPNGVSSFMVEKVVK